MKKVLSLLILAGSVTIAAAQKLEAVKLKFFQKDYAGAKADLDKMILDIKQAKNPEVWFARAQAATYSFYYDSSKCKQCGAEGLESFKKYFELEPAGKLSLDEDNESVVLLSQLFGRNGSTAYSAGDFKEAGVAFKNQLAVSEFIASKNLSNKQVKWPKLDTSVINNLAFVEDKAGNLAEACKYYYKFIEAGMNREEDKDYYKLLMTNYKKLNDNASYDNIVAKFKAAYPGDNYWFYTELYAISDKDQSARVAKYELILPQVASNYEINYEYCAQLSDYLFRPTEGKKPADYAVGVPKLKNALIATKALKNTADVNWVLGNMYYQQYFDMQDERNMLQKSKKPEDVKKVAVKNKELIAIADATIAAAEESIALYLKMEKLANSDKRKVKDAYLMLESMYEVKGNKAKALEFSKQANLYK